MGEQTASLPRSFLFGANIANLDAPACGTIQLQTTDGPIELEITQEGALAMCSELMRFLSQDR
jgi:hypothetical protein